MLDPIALYPVLARVNDCVRLVAQSPDVVIFCTGRRAFGPKMSASIVEERVEIVQEFETSLRARVGQGAVESLMPRETTVVFLTSGLVQLPQETHHVGRAYLLVLPATHF